MEATEAVDCCLRMQELWMEDVELTLRIEVMEDLAEGALSEAAL